PRVLALSWLPRGPDSRPGVLPHPAPVQHGAQGAGSLAGGKAVMSLVHRGRLSVKLGEYAVGNVTALVDALLVARAQDYRRQLAAHMLALEPDDLRERLPDGDYHVSLKVDGEFNLLVYADGEVINVNPGGTVRVGLPFQKEACDLLGKAGVKKALI